MIKYVVLINTNIQPKFCKKINDIDYKMTGDFICFSFEMRTKMKTYLLSCSSQNIVKLLKSFLTLYLLRYSRPLKVKSMIIKENNKIVAIHKYNEINPFSLYGIIEHKFEKKLPMLYKNNFIVESLFEKESNSFRTVINYYLIGKSKKYENDSFYYLYSSLNSLVNNFSESDVGDKTKFNQFLKIFYNCKNEGIDKKSGSNLLSQLQHLLYSKPNLTFENFLLNIEQIEREFTAFRQEKETENTYREYFKYHFLYYLRCKIVHGEKSPALYTLKKETDLLLLQYGNYVIAKIIEDVITRDDFKKTITFYSNFRKSK